TPPPTAPVGTICRCGLASAMITPRMRIPANASETVIAIESLDQEGRGVAHVDGKAVFVEGALPGEQVTTVTLKEKPSYAIARVAQIVKTRAPPARPPSRSLRC